MSFGGCGMRWEGVPPFEFLSTLNHWFPQYDKTFFVDIQQCWYHKGLDGLSTNIEETKTYLETLFQKYQKVVIMGISAGGYAAILFGSLLKVAHVIAFVPQTILRRFTIFMEIHRYKTCKTTIIFLTWIICVPFPT